jgi:hypothetical protein
MAKALGYYTKVVKYLNPSWTDAHIKKQAERLLAKAKAYETKNPGYAWISGEEQDYQQAVKAGANTTSATTGTVDAAALKKALAKAQKDLFNYETKKPKPTWSTEPVPGQVKADDPITAINKLIKSSPVGSAQRQKYMDEKATYERKLAFWNNKLNQYADLVNSARKATQAAEKLPGLIRQQQNNQDTGVKDPKLDTKIDELTRVTAANAAKVEVGVTPPKPIPTPTPTPTPAPTGPTGPTASVTPTGPTGPTKAVTPTSPTGPTKAVTPTGPTGPTVAVTGPTIVTGPTAPVTPLDTLLKKTEFWFDLPDYIFKISKELGDLLVKAAAEGWDNARFLAAAQLTPWWQKNSSTVRTRIVDRAKYDELKAAGEDVSKTDYGLYLKKQMNAVKAKAKEITGVTLTDEQAQGIAQKIYDGYLDDDPLAINALIVPFIGKVNSIVGTGAGTTKLTGFGGDALKNYQTLQSIAKANGFTIKDILPNVSSLTAGGDLETAVLRGLADGSLDINSIAQNARMLAAQGQPNYVRGLLNQGYDLQDVYAPYRERMAATLELDPNTISLNDPTLRSAITDKGDMNLYDFSKVVRQDSRWQYTKGAKQEVSDSALKVLQDFGFQG